MEKTFGLFLAAWGFGAATAAPCVDFTRADTPRWGNEHHISNCAQTSQGLAFTVTGEDPWLVSSTPFNVPACPPQARLVRFSITCAPTTDKDSWQVFFAVTNGFNEMDSCHLLPVGDSPYTRFAAEISVSCIRPALSRIRLDPPGIPGRRVLRTFDVEFVAPLWSFAAQTPPPLVIPAATPLVLSGADWELRHDPDRIGAFRFLSRNKIVENNPAEPFVYLDDSGAPRSLDWSKASMCAAPPTPTTPGLLTTSATLTNSDGRVWTLVRTFRATESGRSLTISTRIKATSDSSPVPALHIPFLTLFVDRPSAGHKHQALLAGVEYLADEPSSSTKEIRTHEHNRLIPAEYRLSAPLAVFTDARNWLSAMWGPFADQVAAASSMSGPAPCATVFDSPDRLFKSGGHLLAFWLPAVGHARKESDLDIYAPTPFCDETQVLTLRTGPGSAVADALEAVITDLPEPDAVSPVPALELLSHGWLDSKIREGRKVRHAVASNFTFHSAGDAPILMHYLASTLSHLTPADANLVARLRKTSDELLSTVPPPDISSKISHIGHPAPVLVAGDITNHLDRCQTVVHALNQRIASGKAIWRPQPGRPDYGETLASDHCNGFTSMSLVQLLSHAVWCGDETEIARALAILDKVTALYHGTVPRGAQPWEMPLHTPDIMASANLTRAYTLGYLLSRNPAHLREARHWAYTGLSMVYLTPPPFAFGPSVPHPVGRYATCAVMGATNWVAPNWIGRPVQWCGLVYAAALWDLARVDATPGAAKFWRTLAEGITASGVRQSHTKDDPDFIGLLPDSWNLEQQNRYACPINPGTVQENYAEAIGRPYYSLRAHPSGVLIHVPGDAAVLPASDAAIRCRVAGWPNTPFRVVLSRLDAQPRSVTLDRRPVDFAFISSRRALVVTLPASAAGELAVVPAAH